jgi:hypothetical protein
MEDFSTPWFTKRTPSAACQALPHRPSESLLHRPGDLWLSGWLLSPTRATSTGLQDLSQTPTPQTAQSPLECAPKACQAGNPQAHDLRQAMPLRPAQACMISALPGCNLKACQAGDPQAFTISGPCPRGLHRPAQSPWATPLRPATPVINRHTPSPLRLALTIRHARPMLQRPARLPQWQASAHKSMGPHSPATSHKRAPNLPRRHRQV